MSVQVRERLERRNGRKVEMVLPAGKPVVMGKAGGKGSDYERSYNCCCWMTAEGMSSWYLLGGHSATIYLCHKQQCLKKVTNLGLKSQIGCLLTMPNDALSVLVSCWDGQLMRLNVANAQNLKLKKTAQRVVYVPRSGDEQSGLKTQSARAMVYSEKRKKLFVGLKTNQIIELELDTIFENESGSAEQVSLLVEFVWGRCCSIFVKMLRS